MISRGHRFHGRNSLRRVYKEGQNIRSQQLSLKCQPNNRKGYRLAVVVSRQVSKSAVVRNRIRRRLYESFRRLATNLVSSQDVILTVFSDRLANVPGQEIDSIMEKIMIKAGLIKKG